MPWEASGRKPYDFFAPTSAPAADTTSLDLSFLGTPTLPSWLGSLTALSHLSLNGAEALTDLTPVASLARLQSLRLSGCRALTTLDTARLAELRQLSSLDLRGCDGLLSLPDMSANPTCEVIGLPRRCRPWESGGRLPWTYDPDATPPFTPRDATDDDLCAHLDASTSPRTQHVVANLHPWPQEDITDGGVEAAVTAGDAASALAPQSLNLAALGWSDDELVKVLYPPPHPFHRPPRPSPPHPHPIPIPIVYNHHPSLPPSPSAQSPPDTHV